MGYVRRTRWRFGLVPRNLVPDDSLVVSRLKYHAGCPVQTFPNRGCLIDRHAPDSRSCITHGNRITMAMIRVEIPFHLQNLARSGLGGSAGSPQARSRSTLCSMLLSSVIRCSVAPYATTSPKNGEASCAILAASRICLLWIPPHRFRSSSSLGPSPSSSGAH